MPGLWEDLFIGKPRTVVDAYNDETDELDKHEKNRIDNALQQNKLNFAPQMSAAELQNKTLTNQGLSIDNKFKPILKGLEAEGKRLDNQIKNVTFQDKPKLDQALIQYRQAAIQKLQADIQNHITKANQKNSVTGFYQHGKDAGLPVQIPTDQSGNPVLPQTNAQIPTIPQSQQEANNPQMATDTDDILLPAGVKSSIRGQNASLINPRTGEAFSTITPTQKTKFQNQILSIQQTRPLIKELVDYGTKNPLGPPKLYDLPWSKGLSLDDVSSYNSAVNNAIEHIMTSTNLQKTNETTHMVNTIVERGKAESPQGYKARMARLAHKLDKIAKDRQEALRLGAMSLDDNEEQDFINSEYQEAVNANKISLPPPSGSSSAKMISVVSPSGKSGRIDPSELSEAIKNGWKVK